jgi:hypothetical protein
MTIASPSTTAQTTELLVPRSIPTTRPFISVLSEA